MEKLPQSQIEYARLNLYLQPYFDYAVRRNIEMGRHGLHVPGEEGEEAPFYSGDPFKITNHYGFTTQEERRLGHLAIDAVLPEVFEYNRYDIR